ncbi:TonB-dependent receptor [Rhodanobacter sp. PCA2]|uniref:TonB-dependent receptor n=1 Tax=Rhodanobacter sp. PCA2 TaxID=2006117 RepID=UPI0015E6C080|nr:TonB-dependent receptor [Rhodanobacter sp. PCA2]MBA2079951.1 hypothetical protein [Rhodanobacter sp. PCA2]
MPQSTPALRHCAPALLALSIALAVAAPVRADDNANGAPSAPAADAAPAKPQDAKDLSAVQVNAATTVNDVAPTQGSMLAIEPQSIVGSLYLQENIAPTGDYTDAAAISPSVYTVTPNGSGLMESAVVSIRGFQDGQYNVTFDGIPWMDSNDFTHHSTSYFTNQQTGSVAVDRGPGTASTLGNATFGGTITVDSISPRKDFGISPYFSLGSWATTVEGANINTGSFTGSGTRAVVNVQNSESDGYLTYAGQRRQSVFAKLVQPVGENTTLTFAAMWNKLNQYVPFGATKAQLAQFGNNYGLNNDPTSQAYYRYNQDKINTNLGYIGLHSELDGWKIDNKVYTYGYNHFGFNGEDPNGETPNGTFYGPDNVPGQHMRNTNRSWGDIFRLARDLGPGEVRTGIWYDHQDDIRWLYEFDDTTNQLNPVVNPGASNLQLASADRRMNDTLVTIQPYLEYQWNIADNAYFIGGVKYNDFKRDINAPVNQKTGTPLNYSKKWTATLPSASFHYAFSQNWTAYAQWAKGYLAPNLNLFYVPNPAVSDSVVAPEKTTNIQLGTTWTNDRLTLSGDVYKINFNNFVQKHNVAGISEFYNGGGVHYKGIELEGTYMLGAGFSIYANGSLNRAIQTTDNAWNANTPHKTAALGLIYSNGPAYVSLVDKFVGKTYYTANAEDDTPIGGYAITNFTASYRFDPHIADVKDLKIGVQLNNIFDNTHINALAGTTGADSTPLYFTIPARNFNFTITADLF